MKDLFVWVLRRASPMTERKNEVNEILHNHRDREK